MSSQNILILGNEFREAKKYRELVSWLTVLGVTGKSAYIS